ncbi:MAG: hypothetical protein UT41_C0001G0011 [Candidatus Wolfebacteria bacterium GW2011_GWC2_39_22]|uniref:Uncharacterized protein n=1 Tax=Candidatus Wolfebacteria bacterium GW2011_GWC2_39_22 TaxID=1619013 RepID=A0A0G0RFM3_9BACT|nr:MAG: hypothetical protein UT41_C0001G0011 [Candidatus Wolfebacteria bacterium GW2011_GWC2_39_22]HBI25853.1 hypothetical protein [Candidatus Wolfebacteria bacterium]
MRKTAFFLGIGAVLMLLIVSLILFFKNETGEHSQNPTLIQTGEEVVISPTSRWPKKQGVRINGDTAVYDVEGLAVYRDGVPGSYGEQGERAQRVAYFATWMELDPLFASAYIDIPQTQKTIIGLQKTQDRFKNELRETSDIYPIAFLTSFLTASASLKDFEKTYSEQAAYTLLAHIKKARDAYEQDIRNLQKVIAPLVTQPHKLVFLDGQGISDYARISADLDIMLRNAIAIKDAITLREQCLTKDAGTCSLSLPSTKEPSSIEWSQKTYPVLSAKELHLRKGTRYDGPYRVEGQCWKESTEQSMLVGTECPDSLSYCFQKSFITDAAYYVEATPGSSYEKFYNQGIQAVPQSATTPYDCIDLEYQMELATIHSFVRTYANEAIFPQILSLENLSDSEKQSMQRGAEAERLFFQSSSPSVRELDYLGNWYGYAYGMLAINHPNTDPIQNLLLHRYAEQRERMSDFYLLANKTYFHFDNFIDERVSSNQSTPTSLPVYVYPIRSHYSLLYMNTSPLVWRIQEHPLYMLKNQPAPKRPEQGGIRSRAYMFDKYGKEAVLRWQDMYDAITPFAHDDR